MSTQEIAPGAAAHILKLLQLAEDLVNRDEKGDALATLAKAKRCVELAAKPMPAEDAESEPDGSTIAERVEAVRVELFDSMAMVNIASRAVSPEKDWCLRHTLETVERRIDSACTALELIAGDAREREVSHG